MRGAWSYQGSPSRPSPSLDSPPLNRQQQQPHHHSSMQSSSRYQSSPYFPSNPSQSATVPPLSANVGQSSFLPDFPWQSSPHSVGCDFSEPPLGTSYPNSGSVEGGYYVGAASSHTMGYPESSQRTHLPEGAYPSIYHTRSDGGASMFDGPQHSTSTQVVANTSHVYQFSELGRHYSSAVGHGADVPSARGSYGGPEGSVLSSSRSHIPSQSVPQPPLYPVSSGLHSSRHTVPSSPHTLPHFDSNTLPPHTSPILSYSYSSRPANFDSRLGEPGSPSVVPPLVFDGEAGEEYDNESECSLHSVSDASRAGASTAQHAGYDGQSRNGVRDDWTGSSFEHANASEETDSPASQTSHLEPQSPSPIPDADLSPSSRDHLEHHHGEPPKSHPKKSKMHQCAVCGKWFPRPSGLATHMNSHSGARPFKCPIPSCNKSFAVRSNAKRHLRTHGIFPTYEQSSTPAQFTVGFDEPIISDVPQAGKLPAKLRWVPQSLATRTNVDHLRDVGSDSEDEYPPSCPVVSVPLPAVVPTSPKWSPDDRYHDEERNSYEQVGASPYLTSQWRALPGPAIVSPPAF